MPKMLRRETMNHMTSPVAARRMWASSKPTAIRCWIVDVQWQPIVYVYRWKPAVRVRNRVEQRWQLASTAETPSVCRRVNGLWRLVLGVVYQGKFSSFAAISAANSWGPLIRRNRAIHCISHENTLIRYSSCPLRRHGKLNVWFVSE